MAMATPTPTTAQLVYTRCLLPGERQAMDLGALK
jgi:hypothetical protein